MARILAEYEYIWAVTYTSPDDGHRLTAEYFSEKGAADKFAGTLEQRNNPQVVQTTLWHDQRTPSERTWYTFKNGSPSEVMVDRVLKRQSAVSKLTPAERKALGV